MASVRVRPESNRLYFDFQYRGQRCREYTLLADTPANRRKCEKVLERIEAEISLKQFDYARYFPNSANLERVRETAATAVAEHPEATRRTEPTRAPAPTTPLFRDFVEIWQRDKAPEWRASYRVTISTLLTQHLLPYFADRPVGEISRAEVLAFRAGLVTKPGKAKTKATGRPRKATTLNRIVGLLRQILDEAAARHDFRNPIDNLKRLKVTHEDIEPFTMDEVRRLISTIRPDFRSYLTVRIFTGLRSSEANGLKWRHVDFERRLLLVRETYFEGRTEATKTDGSVRDIQLSGPVIEALRQHLQSEVERRRGSKDDYVFCTKFGRPIDNKNFTDRIWKPLLRHLDLAYRRPYQLRHTCATLWLAAGENPQWIARQLGHTTTEMLFKTYGRYVPNLVRRDGNAFDQLLTSALLGGVEAAPAEAKQGPARRPGRPRKAVPSVEQAQEESSGLRLIPLIPPQTIHVSQGEGIHLPRRARVLTGEESTDE